MTLNDISRLSNVRIELDFIPIADETKNYAEKNGLNAEEMALYCGEEYEFVFTTDKTDTYVSRIFEKYGLKKPIKIGHVTKGRGVYIGDRRIPRKGWEHFR